MTFPQTPQDLKVALLVGRNWIDITSDVYQRDSIIITRGAQGEATQAGPGRCTLTLNNREGKYSPRNPLSPYYNLLGRNTRVKVYTEYPNNLIGLPIPNGFDRNISTPDSVATSITGDIDVRYDGEARELLGDAVGISVLATKWTSAVGQRSWNFTLDNSSPGSAVLIWQWSADGTAVTGSITSEPFLVSLLSRPLRRTVFRVTLDVNNGAGGNTTTFYYGDTVDGPWYQIGDPVITPGTTSIFNSTAPTAFGSNGSVGGDSLYGTLYGGKILNGINGFAVASPNLTTATIGATTKVDTQVNTWTASGGTFALDTRSDRRFMGEVSSFPPKWDTSGNDAYVQIEAAGILQRLGQGTAPPKSGLREAILDANPRRYWPLDGGPGTTYGLNAAPNGNYSQFVPPIKSVGNPTVSWSFGEGDLGAFLPPSFNLNNSGVTTYAGSNAVSVGSSTYAALDFVCKGASVAPLRAGFYDYGQQQWVMEFSTFSGDITAVFYAEDGAVSSLGSTAELPELTDGAVHHYRLDITQNGVDVDWRIYVDGTVRASGTNTATSVYGMSRVYFRYQPITESPLALGHVVAWSDSAADAADLTLALNGFTGETAGERIERICGISGIPFMAAADLSDSVVMGPQYSEGVVTILRDAEKTDMGILVEPREDVALSYRPTSDLVSQTPRLELDYAGEQVAPPFEPVDDDLLTRNDILATRREGGSYEAELTEGRMSTLSPEDGGVGRYDESREFNVQLDSQLPSVAGWALHLGTVDEARFPVLAVNLAAPSMSGNQADTLAAHTVDIGDLITVDNADAVNFYNLIRLLVVGYTETLGAYTHTIAFNCVSASPYEVATYATSASVGDSHYDTAGSTLNAGTTTTATSLSVASTSTLWTTDSAAFPFDINVDGERMTVTNITSSTSPQAFTVTRSVNAVVKAHLSGADVRLWDTPIYSL